MFKYLKLIGLLKNAQDAYREDTGKDKPWYLSRRFIGALLALPCAVATIQLGITIDNDAVKTLVDNIPTLISGSIAVYGVVMHIVGQFDKAKKSG